MMAHDASLASVILEMCVESKLADFADGWSATGSLVFAQGRRDRGREFPASFP